MSVLLLLYLWLQTGLAALTGDMSAAYPHHVGRAVQADEFWGQAAARCAPASPHRTDMEAQLCGMSLCALLFTHNFWEKHLFLHPSCHILL